jgi:lysozyme
MNQIAVDFIKAHEGCRLTAYQDAGGIWTIGWGATGPDIKQGSVWTQEQADGRLVIDVAKTETAVLKLLKRKLSDQSLAALDSFAYNLGAMALGSSHLIQCVNSGDDVGAAKGFLPYDHVGKVEIKGLLIRRLEEAVLYLRGIGK